MKALFISLLIIWGVTLDLVLTSFSLMQSSLGMFLFYGWIVLPVFFIAIGYRAFRR